LNTKHNPALMMLILVLALAAPGCGVVNRLRAKNSLNDGVREFNKGKYKPAEEKFSEALALSPDLTNAQLFYARSLNAQFAQSLTEDLGAKTIAAYDDIIAKNQDKAEVVDQALAFKSHLYDELTKVNPDKVEHYKQLQRDTLEKRAQLSTATAQTRADVYYTLGVGYWKESYDMNAGYAMRKQTIPEDVLKKMKTPIGKAHEYLQLAIKEQPDYANAWFYEKLVFIEESKVEPSRYNELKTKIDEMQEKFLVLQRQQQAAAAAAAAAAAEAAPAEQ
jgi:tetratricopeptide (TPR) repeat protein